MWNLERHGSKPLFQQIADELERRIRYGEYPPGSTLPSERSLAEQLDVNRSTVVQAYEELRSGGLVERHKGSGTVVSYALAGNSARSLNWRKYSDSGTFMPNLPLIRHIRTELRKPASMIDFASGELSPDLFPHQAVQELLRSQPLTAALGYDDPHGYLPLRQALIAFLEEEQGINATEESILITAGSQQSLYLITQCLLSPGDAIAIEDPSYCYSLPMFRSAGLRVYPLPVHSERGIDPEAILSLHRQHRLRMLFVNPSYQNPTGHVMTPDQQAALLHVCAELAIPIVEDDPFSLTAFEGVPPSSLKAMDTHGQVLYIGSLSKIAASGFRIGWLVAPQSVVNRLADARQQMDFGMSVIPQWVACEFIRSSQLTQHLKQLRLALYEKMHRMLLAIQEQLPDKLSVAAPEGGLSLWCKWKNPKNSDKLFEGALSRGVIYTPGSVFGSNPDYIRLCYARPAASQIETGIRLLADAYRHL